MPERFDVIVIGVGTMGSAACYHLAKRGQRVLGLEQFSIPNRMGSAHGESRVYRVAYYEHPDYVPLLRRAGVLWEALEKESGRTLMHRTGGIFAGPPDSELVAGTLRAAAERDVPCESLDRSALRRRFPQLQVPEDHVGVLEPQAAILSAEAIVAAHAELALHHGAELHGLERVTAWDAEGRNVTVRTDRSEYAADRLVVCGGAWSGALLAGSGVELGVTRQPMAWVWPRRPERFALGTLPIWAIADPQSDGMYYGFPLMPDRPGLKIARHWVGPTASAVSIDRRPGPDDEAHVRDDLRPLLRRCMPDADGPLLSLEICMYTNSPDGHFIVDRHPAHENVVIACGFSGHGFKFASVMGEALADLAVEGGSGLPIAFLGMERFG